MRRVPPERFHVFASYTTREDEVRTVKPIVDHFLNDVLRPLVESTLGEPFVFYDGYQLHEVAGRNLPDPLLETILRFAIEESEVLLAFVSPEYLRSRWCELECRTMASKPLRPWYDVCRKPPIEALRDRRPPGRRPSLVDCALASCLRFLIRSRGTTLPPWKQIVPIVWKGETEACAGIPYLAGGRIFDWTPCPGALEASERMFSHLAHHGSVSPSWQGALRACEKEMTATAEAVVDILLERRALYRSQEWLPGGPVKTE